MKTKSLATIFILFLLIMLGSGLAVFLTKENKSLVLNQAGGIINPINQPAVEKKLDKIESRSVAETTAEAKPVEPKPVAQPEKPALPAVGDEPAKQIQAVMLINGVAYRASLKPDSSVYDLMNLLKSQKKIDFISKNYSGLGFFVEEINGVKNNPAGENWLYYVNGRPAQIGISYYLIKANDVIEWKYENKSF